MWNIPSKEQLGTIPGLYETEAIPLADKLIHLHFFIASCDWYIAEYDGEDTFWGYAILHGDDECAEWGYVPFSVLRDLKANRIEVDCDLYWKIRKASEVEKIRNI